MGLHCLIRSLLLLRTFVVYRKRGVLTNRVTTAFQGRSLWNATDVLSDYIALCIVVSLYLIANIRRSMQNCKKKPYLH
jgi:hypothetical protein